MARFHTATVLSIVALGIGEPMSRPSFAGTGSSQQPETELQTSIERQEYEFSPVPGESGVWSAPNRGQGLRSRVSAAGLELFPRSAGATGAGAEWVLGITTRGLQCGEEQLALASPTLSARGTRVTLDHGQLIEWFENRSTGLEQGWTIATRSLGASILRIQLELSGGFEARIDGQGRSALLANTNTTIPYRDLRAWDACGRTLVARMVASGSELTIEVEDQGAVYPVTVDPSFTWTVEGDQAGAELGASLSSAGDVNGDGFDDVIVAAPFYDDGDSDEGAVFLYLGSAAGLSQTPSWTAEGNQAGALFGAAVSSAGDVNGDDFSDVVIGAWPFDNGASDEGQAFVYHGSATGLSTVPDWTVDGGVADNWFGTAVASAGDVNGDLFDDVIVSAGGYDNGETNEGAAYVYLGSASGLSTSPAWMAEGNQTTGSFGVSVSSAGDVNGDGYDDVIVGADSYDNGQLNEGMAFVFLGSASGLGPNGTPANADWLGESDQFSANLGFVVSSADVNGDGYGDVIIGAPVYDNGEADEGAVFVYLGSASGLGPNGTPSNADWSAEGNQASAGFGLPDSAGDVNGDGYGDVVIGATLHDGTTTDGGRVYLFHGSAGGLTASSSCAPAGDQSNADFGRTVAGAGDVNGDGFDDVLVGAPLYDNGQTDEGRVYLLQGQPTFADVLYEQKISSLEGGLNETLDFDDNFGIALTSLGDMNGDGVGDLAVGSHQDDDGGTNRGAVRILFLNQDGSVAGKQKISDGTGNFPSGQLQDGDGFGVSVATLGDLDGDSITDIAVGAVGEDNGGSNLGGVRILLLNSDGTVKSQNLISDGTSGFPTGALEDQDGFGIALASLGDLDGDDIPDLAVGALGDNDGGNNRGAVRILFLNANGTVKSHALISDGNGGLPGGFLQDNDEFGYGLGNLGDLDGPGESARALAVGGRSSDAGGRLWILFLDSSGSVIATQRIGEGLGGFTGDLDYDDAFGYAIANLGEVGGPGVADVAVSAIYDDDSGTDDGAVWILSLDSSGATVAQTKLTEGVGGFQGPLNTDVFGSGLASLGDLDGDGRTDLAVGAAFDDDGNTSAGAVWICFLNDGTLRHGPRASRWTGAVDSAWIVAGNWSNAVPDSTITAIIPDAGTTANDPVISSGPQACDSLWIQRGGTLEVSAGTDSLGVFGGATVSGPITGTGELVFEAPGTLAGNSTISAAGGVRADFDLAVQGGPLSITEDFTANANVDVRPQTAIDIGGNLSILGNLLLQGSVIVDGVIEIEGSLSGSSEAIISGNTGPCSISIGGDVNFGGQLDSCQLRLDNPSGEFIVVDVTNPLPATLVIDFPAGGGVLLASDLTVEGGLEILNGSLDVQGNALILPGAMQVLVGDLLAVGAGGRVSLETNAVTIQSGGTLRLIGSPTDFARFDGVNGGGYTFLVEAGGTLEARNFSFEDMDGSGIVIDRNALIGAAPDDLRNGLFDRLATSGRLLEFERASPASFRYLRFENTGGLATSNVFVPATSAAITFTNWSGAFAGEAFDDDVGGLLTWGPSEQTLVTSFTARRTLATSVRLDWTSTVEVDCEDFVLERGPSASGPWTPAGEVSASGPQGYVHQDASVLPHTAYHYRLSERLTHGALRVLGNAYAPTKSPGRPAPPPPPLGFSASGPSRVGPRGDYHSIQPALDALSFGLEESATLVIEPGRYEAFELDGRARHAGHWQLIAAKPGSVVIDVSRAPLSVRGLDAGSSLVLSGLVLDSRSADRPTLVLADSAGIVILDQLEIEGTVELDRASAVLLQDSTLDALALDHGSRAEVSTTQLDSFELRGGSELVSFGLEASGLELEPRIETGSRLVERPLRPELALSSRPPEGAPTLTLDAPPGSIWWLLSASELEALRLPALVPGRRELERLGPARLVGHAARSSLALPRASSDPTSLFCALVLEPSGEFLFSKVASFVLPVPR